MVTNNFNIYNSVSAFIQEISTAKTKKMFLDYYGGAEKNLPSQSVDDNGTWYGTKTFDEAEMLLKHGDKASADKLAGKTAEKVALKLRGVESIRPTIKNDIVGGSVNVGALLSGSPRCMRRRVVGKQQTKSKIINIVYSSTVGSSVQAAEITEVNANVVAAIVALERAGYRVNLYVNYSADHNTEGFSVTIKIKSSDSYLNIINMSYILINPSFLRRHVFRYIETRQFKAKKYWPDKYGRVRREESYFKEHNNNNFKYDVFFSFYDVRGASVDDIIKTILK